MKYCTFGRMRPGVELLVTTDYNGIGKILYLLKNAGIEPVSSEYTDRVTLRLVLPASGAEAVKGSMVEATGGKVKFEKIKELYFVDKE